MGGTRLDYSTHYVAKYVPLPTIGFAESFSNGARYQPVNMTATLLGFSWDVVSSYNHAYEL